ncbi:MAG: hypothetical protein NTY35_04800 [Planctomycetota bacterium]|nr:hypothetical protein [Planctomycetota bacterium]
MRSNGTNAPATAASDGVGSTATFPWLAVLAATALAFALRVPALFQDPWIDEVWSWGLARSRSSILDVLTIESSNSHALNTLWIWLLGDQPTFLLYRLPSLLFGLASVPLAARIALRHGRPAAICAAWIVAVSYLSVVYATEARGYALLVLCSLLAFETAWTWLDTGDRRWLAASWACAAVGILAQTLFVVGWAAIALAVVLRIVREGRASRWGRIAAYLGVPVGLFVVWWFVNVRHVFNAGAPPWDLAAVLTETLAWSLGLPVANWSLVLGAVLAAGILVLDARLLASRGDRTWVAQVGVALVGSVATAILLRHEYLAPRYFLVPLAFWSLSLARVLGHFAEVGRAGRVQAASILVLFAAGNLAHAVPFLRVGRGAIGDLVRAMATRSDARPIVVTGNYDFNVGALLEWHRRSLPAGRELVYVPQKQLPPGGPDFAVTDHPHFESEPPTAIRIGTRSYDVVGVSRHAGPSGSDWAVYQRR